MKTILAGFVALGAALGMAAAAPEHGHADLGRLSGAIKIDGSSTVYPITEAVAEEFAKEAKGVSVTVGISGTGGGFKRFAVGETDISDASRPIKKGEADTAAQNKIEFIEIPVAYDGLSIVVSKKNNWLKDLTVDELKKIFLDGNYAKTWKDVRPEWPANTIKIYSPGTDSGTFDYFKEVIASEKGQSIRGDMSVSEDDNVLVRGIEGDENAIGFFGCAYYFENADKLNVVQIDGGHGKVAPSAETIENGTYAPFSRPLFIYVNKTAADRPEVKAFVEFYLQHAPELVKDVGYVPLPKAVYSTATKNFGSKKTGSQFIDGEGKHKKGKVTDLYK